MTEITIGAVCSCGWSAVERDVGPWIVESVTRAIEGRADYHRAVECPPIGTPPLEGEGKGWGETHG